MNDTLLLLVFLGPPAVYGIARAVEDWMLRRELRQAQDRHPSADPLRVCDICQGPIFDEKLNCVWCVGRPYDGETR